MDLLCPKCGEPWEFDSIHEATAEARAYAEDAYDARRITPESVAADFRRRGCPALGGRCTPNQEAPPEVAALYELLGDDMDGAAAMLEDLGL